MGWGESFFSLSAKAIFSDPHFLPILGGASDPHPLPFLYLAPDHPCNFPLSSQLQPQPTGDQLSPRTISLFRKI